MKNNKNNRVIKMQEAFGDNEIHICCVANKNKVGCCSINTTKIKYEDIKSFDKDSAELEGVNLTAISSVLYSIKMLENLYTKDKEAVEKARVLHLMINDAAYTSYVCSSKYGNVLDKVLNGMLEVSEIEQEMCKLIKQITIKFPNLIIDPVSVGEVVSEDSDLKCLISQSWDLVLGDKANKKKRSKFASAYDEAAIDSCN